MRREADVRFGRNLPGPLEMEDEGICLDVMAAASRLQTDGLGFALA